MKDGKRKRDYNKETRACGCDDFDEHLERLVALPASFHSGVIVQIVNNADCLFHQCLFNPRLLLMKNLNLNELLKLKIHRSQRSEKRPTKCPNC
ncbi:hypothetical protein H257_17874 [Aphanomyces astaci]|uniref:Uncharacterized protein n=1 Tax=Aphanomyces astaci TaxID=112090 RepID=W4FF70_APHAT|nr:hypothetical protein H257_17874 [Aphanomyces astaci]ETV65383.1 hypothetical protein H257_17874 [Aphanomyces astaci]|eukprot:XP_009845128.1 hypothetical protein H257_17874 [Aphanomyces astaci]